MEANLPDNEFEARVARLARAFPYPATPPVADTVATRLRADALPARGGRAPAWIWIATALVLALAALMAVPSVRAAVIEFLQIGVIRIFTGEETPPLPPGEDLPAAPTPLHVAVNSVLELAGEVTLDQAREMAPFPILLPAYPPELGAPDKVFYQQLENGRGVFLVWLNDGRPDKVKMSLLLFGPGVFVGKSAPTSVAETTVNGQRAVWTEGEHLLVLQTGPNQRELAQLFVEGNVLIWEINGITYRLESEFSMEEAVRIAESVHQGD